MENFMYIEINIITLVILFIILLNVRERRFAKLSMDQFLFRGLLIVIFATVVFDTLIVVFNGWQAPYAREINIFVTMMYYILNPLSCFLWLLYADYKMNRKRNALIRKIPKYSIPFIINLLFCVASIFTQWIFVINDKNIYARGPLFFIFVICSVFYLVAALLLAIREVGRRDWDLFKSEFKYYVIFPILVIVLSIIQTFMFGTSIIWVGAVLMLLSIFMAVQKNEIFTDYLTGLYNRKILDNLLELKISKHKKESRLFLALIDVDDFKEINDTYGHIKGDKALIHIADILRSVCVDADDVIVRLGGDEFLLAGERDSLYKIEYLKNDLLYKVEKFNSEHIEDYTLSLSIGFAILDDNVRNANDLIVAADHRMYAHKQSKKQSH